MRTRTTLLAVAAVLLPGQALATSERELLSACFERTQQLYAGTAALVLRRDGSNSVDAESRTVGFDGLIRTCGSPDWQRVTVVCVNERVQVIDGREAPPPKQ